MAHCCRGGRRVKRGTTRGVGAMAGNGTGNTCYEEFGVGMVTERLAVPVVGGGFILDGYPRNLVQCAALEDLLARLRQPLDIAIKLDVPDSAILALCELRFAAEHRPDDDPAIVRKRLQGYAAPPGQAAAP